MPKKGHIGIVEIPVSKLVTCAFSTIPICPFLFTGSLQSSKAWSNCTNLQRNTQRNIITKVLDAAAQP